MNNDNDFITKKNIKDLKVGDIILCKDGFARTLCKNNIHEDSFFGRSIFGDSYASGHEFVDLITNYGKYQLTNENCNNVAE